MKPLVTSPEQFFGYQLGSAGKIARWDRVLEYFHRLENESDCIKNIDMGESTEGNPFLLTIITSAENLANLEHLRQVNLKISDPRGLTEDAVRELVKEGKSVICQSMSLHANEIGGTQMAPELAYDLLSSDSDEVKQILENVIFLMIPCFNPDGQIMVADWYNRWLGTEYEGCSLPWLYQKYTGHDNNRDAVFQNIAETEYVGKIMLRDWKPQAYQDHHHMGSFGARLFVSPYAEPIRPHIDPLVWRELSWYGGHMAYKLEEGGKTGVINAARYGGWGHMGFHWLTPFHNIAGMLTESASAKLATPLYIHQSQIEGAHPKHHPENKPQTNFPHPWPGGWWTLREIVEQQKISAYAILDLAAKYKDTVLWNAYLKAKRQTETGAMSKPCAYAIAPEQNDPLTALKFVRILLNQGVEVHRAKAGFELKGCSYPAGTYVVFLAQPKMGIIKTIMGRQFYPDYYWTRNPDGSPIMFDMATDTFGEYMGVDIVPLETKPAGEFVIVEDAAPVACEWARDSAGYLLDTRLNDAYQAVNRLLAAGHKVYRVEEPVVTGDTTLPAGAFYVENSAELAALAEQISTELGVGFGGLAEAPKQKMHALKPQRIALFQRYWGGNMDEGWTRHIFDNYKFPYETVMDADITKGDLHKRFDVLVLPSDHKVMMVGFNEETRKDPAASRLLLYHGNVVPPEYNSGFGDEGTKAIREFVENGGRLVALDAASDFVIEAFGLGVRNVVAGTDYNSFYCNGSTLRVNVDTSSELAYGMPENALVLNIGSPTFEIQDRFNAQDYEIVVEYPEEDLLQSGLLVGEDLIKGRAAMLSIKHGEGRIVLIGFRSQFRAQTHGTYKLFFNTLY